MGVINWLTKWFEKPKTQNQELLQGSGVFIRVKTKQEYKELFASNGLGEKFELFEPLFRNKINLSLNPTPDTEILLGQSKIGGKPDLAQHQDWPVEMNGMPLSFIGQINCQEINTFDKEQLLPAEGLISFFYCADQYCWGGSPGDADSFRVYFNPKPTNLIRKEFPTSLEEQAIYWSNKLDFDSTVSLPEWEHDKVISLLSDDEEYTYSTFKDYGDNQLFGYADSIQGSMESQVQDVTNGISYANITAEDRVKMKQHKAGIEDWILLMQIDSEEEKANMLWGDCGRLYFWIRKQDLKDEDFGKCWCILQCC